MAFKLNIQSHLDRDIESLMKKCGLKSKTEYINRAVAEFNEKLKRGLTIESLKSYFQDYKNESKIIMDSFSKVRRA